jgi:hypothetical protein
MNIKKTATGLQYFCHRCSEGGFVQMDNLSPDETLEMMKRIEERKTEEKVVDKIEKNLELPLDCVYVITNEGKWNSEEVPWKAIHWLWGAGFMAPDEVEFEVLWSKKHNRVIFPIYYRKITPLGTVDGALEGWVGRNVDGEKPKYLTRKTSDERLLYKVSGSEEVVFVEDILSALKVHKATGYTCVALLTTHIDFHLAKQFVDRKMYLWLDGDMYTKSIKKVKRLNQFGFKIKSVRTELDPKEYTKEEIWQHLGNG